jgi:hypothetical protein
MIRKKLSKESTYSFFLYNICHLLKFCYLSMYTVHLVRCPWSQKLEGYHNELCRKNRNPNTTMEGNKNKAMAIEMLHYRL